jgi:hypothetical protein
MALVAAPALSSARVAPKAMVCQNNLRQLTAGWQLYAVDNREKICMVADQSSDCPFLSPPSAGYLPGGANAAWILGSIQYGGTRKVAATDERSLTYGLLYSYVRDVKLYRCPMDPLFINGVPTTRSYSANGFLNPITSSYMTTIVFRKMTDILRPSQTFVYIEESSSTINDGSFFDDPAYTSWVDIPAIYHAKSTFLSFADGHVESKQWHDPALISSNATAYTTPADGGVDLHWLQARTTY